MDFSTQVIAVVEKPKKGQNGANGMSILTFLRRVDNENVALALTGVIKGDSFSVRRPFGSYGRGEPDAIRTQSATSNFSAGHIIPRSAFAIPASRNPRSARAMQDGVRLALLHFL